MKLGLVAEHVLFADLPIIKHWTVKIAGNITMATKG